MATHSTSECGSHSLDSSITYLSNSAPLQYLYSLKYSDYKTARQKDASASEPTDRSPEPDFGTLFEYSPSEQWRSCIHPPTLIYKLLSTL